MRIIFLEAVQNFGGSKRSVIDIAAQLKELGHTVLIADFWGANAEFNSAVKASGLELKVLDKRSSPVVLGRDGVFPKFFEFCRYALLRSLYKSRLRYLVSEFKPDYICVNSAKTLDILSKRGDYKIDYYARGWRLGSGLSERYLVKKYRPRFVAISEATRHALFMGMSVPLDQTKVLKVTLGAGKFPSPNYDPSLSFGPENPIRLLHAGSFVENKGQRLAIYLAAALRDRGVQFKLRLAGIVTVSEYSARYYQSLRELVKKLDLNELVEFVVDNHDLRKEMSDSDLFIYPSKSEGLSRVCLEAMSSGKPVLANPVGGITDYLISGYNGYLVTYNSVEEYVKFVMKYYEEPGLCAAHGRKGVEIVNSCYLNDSYRDGLRELY